MTSRRSVTALWVLLAVAVADLTAAVGVLATSSPRPDAPAASSTPAGSLAVTAPSSVVAGEAVVLRISGGSPSADSAAVVVTSTAGTVTLTAPLHDGHATFELPTAATSSAGVVTAWVIAGGDEAVTEVRVAAADAVSPIVPLVGAKSIVADGVDRAMVVGLPADRFGNPVENRGEVVMTHRRSLGGAQSSGVTRTGLIVWQWLRAGTVAGTSQVTLRLGAADGPAADLDEVPGVPGSISLSVDNIPLVADGRTLHVVTTGQLSDRFGNGLLDGTAVRLLADTPTGRQQATATTIGGRARFELESPTVPGPVRLTATTAGVEAAPLQLDFAPAVQAWPVRAVRTSRGWVVEVGPVERIGGGWAPDGAEVTLVDGSVRRTAQLDAGQARFVLRSRPSAGAEIRILGVAVRLVP